MALCESVVVEDRHTGTHFLWHLLNAVVLFLLMRASLETETKPQPVEETPKEEAPAAAAQPEEADKTKEEPETKDKPEAEEEPEATKASEDEQAPDDEGASSDSAEKDLAKDEGDAKGVDTSTLTSTTLAFGLAAKMPS